MNIDATLKGYFSLLTGHCCTLKGHLSQTFGACAPFEPNPSSSVPISLVEILPFSFKRLMICAMAQNKVVLEITDHFRSVLRYDCFDHKPSRTSLMADEQ